MRSRVASSTTRSMRSCGESRDSSGAGIAGSPVVSGDGVIVRRGQRTATAANPAGGAARFTPRSRDGQSLADDWPRVEPRQKKADRGTLREGRMGAQGWFRPQTACRVAALAVLFLGGCQLFMTPSLNTLPLRVRRDHPWD